jgi:hypothetical protein
MSPDDLNKKINNIYSKIREPKHICNNWIIVADSVYERYKNKLTIININNIQTELIADSLGLTIMCESKHKYHLIKYTPQFIGIVEADTEYGLLTESYNIFAVNSEVITNSPPFNKNLLSIKDIFKVLGWKLNKETKDYLSSI